MTNNRFLTALIFLLSFYFIFSLSKSTYNLWQKAELVKEAQEKRTKEEKKNTELKKKLQFTQSQEFVEKEAREKLGWTKPGEMIVVIPPFEATQSAIEAALPNWKRWLKLFF